jgi:Na+-transporting methylmalonyl-CoA/oxaloacetate decarboxylase gamma subunit
MQNRQRFPLMQRFLFPYNGEEALTPRQGARVMLAWAILLPLILSLLVTVVPFLVASSWQRILALFAFAFFSGMCIFGILGLLIILVNNRSARIRRAWKAPEAHKEVSNNQWRYPNGSER